MAAMQHVAAILIAVQIQFLPVQHRAAMADAVGIAPDDGAQ